MKIFPSLLSVCIFSFLLSGCDCDLVKDLKLSQLFEKPHDETAVLTFEITGCNDYEDSRKPSSSLLKAQKIIPSVFSGAVFKQCYSKSANSYAEFEIPVLVGYSETDNLSWDKDIFFFCTPKTCGIAVGDEFNKRFNDMIKNNAMSPRDVKVNVTLAITNDLDNPMHGDSFSIYMNDTPYSIAHNTLLNNKKVKYLRLGNTAVDQIIGAKRTTPVFNWIYGYKIEPVPVKK